MRTMFDAANPQPVNLIKDFDIAAGYIGYPKATPHVWSLADWNSQPNRYRLPIFVPSWWAGLGWDTVRDVNYAVSALSALGLPKGCTVGLDMETQIQPSYVGIWIQGLNKAGYGVMVYGSKSYVYQNPIPTGATAGYWPADWTGTAHLLASAWGTQYGSQQGANYDFDLNLVADSIPLWDIQTGSVSMTLELSTLVPNSNNMVVDYADIGAQGFAPGGSNTVQALLSWTGARVAHIANKVDSGVPILGSAPTSTSLSDADVQRIAVAVAKEISKGLSNG